MKAAIALGWTKRECGRVGPDKSGLICDPHDGEVRTGQQRGGTHTVRTREGTLNRTKFKERQARAQLSKRQATLRAQYSGIGKTIKFKHKGRAGFRLIGKIIDEVSVICDEYKHVMQRIRFEPDASNDGCRYAYRTGYWTWTGDGKGVVWGQYTQLLSEREQRKMIARARARGWPIFSR